MKRKSIIIVSFLLLFLMGMLSCQKSNDVQKNDVQILTVQSILKESKSLPSLPTVNQIPLESAQMYFQNYLQTNPKPIVLEAFTIDLSQINAMIIITQKSQESRIKLNGFRTYFGIDNKGGKISMVVGTFINKEGDSEDWTDEIYQSGTSSLCPILCDISSPIMSGIFEKETPVGGNNQSTLQQIDVKTAHQLYLNYMDKPQDAVVINAFNVSLEQLYAGILLKSNMININGIKFYSGEPYCNEIVGVNDRGKDLTGLIYKTPGNGLCPFICDVNSSIIGGGNQR